MALPGLEKTLWGAEQLAWFKETLAASDATFKILISPTPMIGPDDANQAGRPAEDHDPVKRDNYSNPGGFRDERDELFAWLIDNDFLDKNFYIICGDRHWQYHSIDPTGFEEFSTGAIIDANSRVGRPPGDPDSNDPDALVMQFYTYDEPTGGFLHVTVTSGETPTATFRFYDEQGTMLYEHVKQAMKRSPEPVWCDRALNPRIRLWYRPRTMGPGLTRRRLLQSTFVASGILGGGAVSPLTAVARETQPSDVSQTGTATSISREFGRWVAGLRYEDLPPEVVDRAKGLTLHALASALLGSQLPGGRRAIELITQEEEGVPNGATVMVAGTRATKAGAAFANAEMILAGGKWDTFRMLTHPGTSILPAALAAAEIEAISGRDFITGLVAGYEVMERMAADFIPTVMARGFHAGPVFGIFGAAVAAAKILRFTEDQLTNAIGLSVNLAGGNLGSGGLRESAAVRNAMLAVALARQGRRAGETSLEGEAGFYHAYAGNNRGELTYSFVGDTRASLAALTAELGDEWLFLETLYRIYSTAGYNIAHVDVTAQLCAEQNITFEDVDRVEAVVNWLETQYPSPAFPTRREDTGEATPGSTRYYTAYGVVARGFPLLAGTPDPPEVLDLMTRVTIIPSHDMTLFGPRITIFTKDGRSYTKQATGREFVWDFDEEARRIRDVIPGIPVSAARFEDMIATCRDLDREGRADRLVRLTMP